MQGESDDDEGWDDFNEPEVAPTQCLFTTQIFESAALCLAHAKSAHGLDLAAIAVELRLDIYGRVQLVNYVRTLAGQASASPADIVKAVKQAAAGDRKSWPWAEERFMKPVLAEDPLLYSLGAPTGATAADDVEMEAEETPAAVASLGAGGAAASAAAGGEEQQSAALLETIQLMRSEMVTMLGLSEEDVSDGAPRPAGASDGSAGGGGGSSSSEGPLAGAKKETANEGAANGKAAAGATQGEYGSADGASTAYFESYAKLSIHEEMLADGQRRSTPPPPVLPLPLSTALHRPRPAPSPPRTSTAVSRSWRCALGL